MIERFVLLGAAGFVAPRHMKAIQQTGNQLIAALDPFDSVGVIDQYAPDAAFFTDFARFDRFVAKCQQSQDQLTYASICSPNYLHDMHIRFALRSGLQVICEKPLVINPWNLERLAKLAHQTGLSVNTILQLRLHPVVAQLRQDMMTNKTQIADVELTYITRRGKWYDYCWKGDETKSGGLLMNIGVHLFDLLLWLFGPVQQSQLYVRTSRTASGYLQLARANIRWFLSVDADQLPKGIREQGMQTYRGLSVNGKEYEFSQGFTDLHTTSYRKILSGQGFDMNQAKPAIALVHQLRQEKRHSLTGDYHPFCQRVR